MAHYEPRLPHWDTIGEPLFVTFRLSGSLPGNRIFPPEQLTTAGRAFVAMDRLLDTASSGPFYLQRPEIATLVMSALRDGEQRFHRYQLHAFAVMPNHLHLLVTPTRWLGPMKGFTAHQANRLLRLSGQSFWQDES